MGGRRAPASPRGHTCLRKLGEEPSCGAVCLSGLPWDPLASSARIFPGAALEPGEKPPALITCGQQPRLEHEQRGALPRLGVLWDPSGLEPALWALGEDQLGEDRNQPSGPLVGFLHLYAATRQTSLPSRPDPLG